MTVSELTIALAVKDPGARREFARMLGAMDGIRLIREAAEADILVLEARMGDEEDMRRLGRASTLRESGEIFLACTDPDPSFLIQAMRAGVDEVLVLPPNRKELARAISRFRSRSTGAAPAPAAAPATGRVIGVVGVRPGVGATTLAVNLAAELHRASPAALLDMGMPLSEAPIFLDMEYEFTWNDVIQNLARLDATYLGSVMPRHASGLSLLASPGEQGLEVESPESMDAILTEMRRSFANIVVDTDAVLSPLGLRELERAEDILVVLNLTLPCLAHAQRLAGPLERLESAGSRVRLVASRQAKAGGILPEEAQDVLGRRIDWVVPEDGPAALSAMNQGLPLSQAAPKSPAAKAVRDMVASLSPDSGRSGLAALGSIFRKKKNAKHENALGAMEAI